MTGKVEPNLQYVEKGVCVGNYGVTRDACRVKRRAAKNCTGS